MVTSLLRRARLRAKRIGAASDAGFSLLEVIVSFVIFSVVAGAATAAIVSALQASHSSQQRVDAAQVAQQFVADVERNPSGSAKGTVTVPGSYGVKNEQFTVTRTITWTDPAGTTSITCPSGVALTLNVVVAQQQSGKVLARSDTEVAC